MTKPWILFSHCLPAQLALTLLLTCSVQAQKASSYKVTLDPAQTEIRWKVSGGLRPIHGTFQLKTGQLVFSPKTGIAEGEILVDATTGATGNSSRDKRMQDEVLESNRYPAIFFHPTTMKGFKEGTSPQEVASDGTFNIHGADHEMQLPLQVQVNAGVMTVTTHFTVPYVEWGMQNPSRLFMKVGRQVEIDVSSKGTIKAAE